MKIHRDLQMPAVMVIEWSNGDVSYGRWRWRFAIKSYYRRIKRRHSFGL
jgi:hypothetical protein